MGATQSSDNSSNYSSAKQQDKLIDRINEILYDYMTTTSFKELVSMLDRDVCDKMVLLIASELKESMGTVVLEKLGIVNYYIPPHSKNKDIQDLQCIETAERAVKIFHIYAAIKTTIDPLLITTGTEINNSDIKIVPKLSPATINPPTDRGIIPKIVEVIPNPQNMCTMKIGILQKFHPDFDKTMNSTISCNTIDTLKKGDSAIYESSDSRIFKAKYLPNVLGLLFPGNFDSKTGETGTDFNNENNYFNTFMSSYASLTPELNYLHKKGIDLNNKIPSDNTTFANIRLNNFASHTIDDFKRLCKSTEEFGNTLFDEDGKFRKDNGQIQFISEYANHLKKSELEYTDSVIQLLGIIDNKLFTNGADGKPTIRIETMLIPELDIIMKQTRDIIMKMHNDCERNFIKGLKLYEAILENERIIRENPQPL